MLRKLCQCIGVASLILLSRYAGLLGGGSSARLHSPHTLTSVCLTQSADILLVGVILFIGIALLQRTFMYPMVRLLLLIGMPPYILLRTRSLFPFTFPHHLFPALALGWVIVVVLLYVRQPVWYERIVRLSGELGVAFALFALCSIAQILLVIRWKPLPQQYSAVWNTTPQAPRTHPRLVWLILDELSYDQTFEHRQPGLVLPNFDVLRSQSILFTNVQPAGYATTDVIPSLLSGNIVDDVDYDMHSSLRIHHPGRHGWQSLSGRDTVFADAQKAGWRTAVVGWFNPYCSVYRDGIDDCYWANQDAMEGALVADYPASHNFSESLRHIALGALPGYKGVADVCDIQVEQHYRSHAELEPRMLQLLHTDQADFIFLHLGVPHSPSIWNRHTGQYRHSCGGSYLDGLALADREVGLILTSLQNSPRWKDTTLIVEGDHSWRIRLWLMAPSWTHEDDAASKDAFDPRPALLVHRAGQTQPETNATQWPLIRVHQMVEEVLHGQRMQP